MRNVPLLVITLFSVAGCGAGGVVDESAPLPTGPPPTVAAPSTSLVTATTPTTLLTTTSRPAATTTTRPPVTTTTTRPLSRAEATAKLCATVASAADAVQAGRLVAGGWRLAAGLASYEKTADPGVASAARRMLRSGLDGDAEGYLDATSAASTACARAGSPIRISGPIQCVAAPCP